MPIVAILGYLSYVDVKKREVPDLLVLALFLYSFFIIQDFKASFVMGGIVSLIQLLLAVVSNGGIGGGDIKLFSAVAFLMGNDLYLLAFPMAVFMAGTLIFCAAAKKGLWCSVPFVPYIFVSFLFYFLLEVIF
ncbi:prepilin peptidase [Tepidanaerobacter acetatoxydans]|uniref:prepilin peptidase n=1 Tax=Tepidanaerobacter acetatoxydans TaxID=499229 RepID=UPI001BD2F2C7